MKEETSKIYLAILLSLAAIFATNYFFPAEAPQTQASAALSAPAAPAVKVEHKQGEEASLADAPILETAQVLGQDRRVPLSNPALEGSIRLRGARLDNLYLSRYRQSLDKDSPLVELLAPAGTKQPYYAEFGWIPAVSGIEIHSTEVPGRDTLWTPRGANAELTPQTPLVLEWSSPQGLKFIRKITLDGNYLFTVEDTVENGTQAARTLHPYGLVSRAHSGETPRSVVYSGPIAVVGSKLVEKSFDAVKDAKTLDFKTDGGWAGFTDHYWFAALLLDGGQEAKVRFASAKKDTFQADYVKPALTVEPGASITATSRFYAGAKEIKLIDRYAKDLRIDKFDRSVDFGWYYFLTKPFFYILDFLYRLLGNMGWAILTFAALLRLAMFPVANKSYESMSKMKKVQPRLLELKERYASDKLRLQQATMELYKREKINPAAGCLPMLIQIPVFFSLYKVLNFAIEIRQAPFVGWIKDLSEPDPLTFSALTGLPIPGLLDIGVWPVVMGLTMWLQMRLNPAPMNKDQARMFALMPLVFTFMLGHFAAGLVIYWAFSNLLGIVQQKAIMHKYGV